MTVVEAEDVIVAEAYALVGVPGRDPGVQNRLWVFLGRTRGAGGDPSVLRRASVTVRRPADGVRFRLERAELDECVSDPRRERPGVCYDAGVAAVGLRSGDELELDVRLPDGRTLEGRTRIPGTFRVEGEASDCALPPNTPFEVRWTPSDGARAYVNETRIDGLDVALGDEGIEAPDELYLLGLSLSASDTTIVFPGEFGVFDRFDLDQDLTVRLQQGLPEGTQATVGISAADRNYVDWARGGNFNPSGQIRVPSVRGDGTGVFASVVMRRFGVFVGPSGPAAALPPCRGSS
ncbi:MAG: hypothetical protein U5R14_13650 [Gemmatimonadota bacterium]|nr:hypothetical protein [Gemmatimonadota bacterium]